MSTNDARELDHELMAEMAEIEAINDEIEAMTPDASPPVGQTGERCVRCNAGLNLQEQGLRICDECMRPSALRAPSAPVAPVSGERGTLLMEYVDADGGEMQSQSFGVSLEAYNTARGIVAADAKGVPFRAAAPVAGTGERERGRAEFKVVRHASSRDVGGCAVCARIDDDGNTVEQEVLVFVVGHFEARLCPACANLLAAALAAPQPSVGTGEREALRAVLAEAEAALNEGRIDPRMTHIVLIASAALAAPAPVVAPGSVHGRCGVCDQNHALHRIGDDACPIIDGDDLSFSQTARFAAAQLEPDDDEIVFEGEMPEAIEYLKRAAAQPEPSEPDADAEWCEGAAELAEEPLGATISAGAAPILRRIAARIRAVQPAPERFDPERLFRAPAPLPASEMFDQRAEQFYRETGYMAPGKSVPAAMSYDGYDEARNTAWAEWNGRAPAPSGKPAGEAAVRGSNGHTRDCPLYYSAPSKTLFRCTCGAP